MCALYAFLRVTDDLADGPGSPDEKRPSLKRWRADLHSAMAGEDRHPCHPALRHTLARFGVPIQYLGEVIDGCESDLEPVSMPDFAALYRYCFRVASAVGLACIHVWGFRDAAAKTHAEHAGVALQLTNILRDLPEDLDRGRLYIPAEDLVRFGLRPASLGDPADPAFRALMRFEADRARAYYRSGERLISFLDAPGRAVFQVLLRTYRGLLDEIERRDFDVFRERVRLSPWRKAALLVRALPVRWGWVG
jgi:phytoene synthase